MIRNQCATEMLLDEILVKLNQKEQDLLGKRASTESLLDAIQDASNVLSCTPLAHAALDELTLCDIDDIESILREASPPPRSFADSIILQDESGELLPPEFSKPRTRTKSMIFHQRSLEDLEEKRE